MVARHLATFALHPRTSTPLEVQPRHLDGRPTYHRTPQAPSVTEGFVLFLPDARAHGRLSWQHAGERTWEIQLATMTHLVRRRRIESGLVCQVGLGALETMWRVSKSAG